MTTDELINILELSGEIVNLYSQQSPLSGEIQPSGAFLAKIHGDINKSYLFDVERQEETLAYTVSNSIIPEINGDYILESDKFDNYPVYKNKNNYVIYMTTSWGWCLSPAVRQAPIYGVQYNFDSEPPISGWSGEIDVVSGILEPKTIFSKILECPYNNIVNKFWYAMEEVEGKLITVNVYAEHFENPIDGYYFNGEYIIEDPFTSELSARYINKVNGTELYYTNYGGWSFRPISNKDTYFEDNAYVSTLSYKNNPWNVLTAEWVDKKTNSYFNGGTINISSNESVYKIKEILEPCKVFDYGDTEEIPLITLETNNELEFSLSLKNDEKDLSVYFNPEDAETVGKIVWEVSDNLKDNIELIPAKDTLSCNVKLIEDIGTNVLSGKIIANPLDNKHENIINGKIEFLCNISGSLESGNENTYKLSVSNFPMVVQPTQFTQLNPNGIYELSNSTETGTNRVWVRNNEFKIYFDYPNWILVSCDASLNVKFYMGDDNSQSPYKEDGSTHIWFNRSEAIENASVILLTN
jgi:hypothetical protein